MTLRRGLTAGALILVWLLAVAVPGIWFDEQRYGAYASGVQAFGLVLALALGVWTLVESSRNQRVDRVLALHAELTAGETDRARRRLATHLRMHASHAGKLRQVTDAEMRDQSTPLGSYAPPNPGGAVPIEDAVVVVRLFERVRLAQLTGSLDDPMCAELIGRHAGWWHLALEDNGKASRVALAAFAEWANAYAESHSRRHPYLASWGATRKRDFGQV